jgi:hypothetical protein
VILQNDREFGVRAQELRCGLDGRLADDGSWRTGTLLAFNDEDAYAWDPSAVWQPCPKDAAYLSTTSRKVQLMGKRVVRSANIKHESGLTVRKANIARAKPFQWAWDQRILLSYINILMGEEGVGKGNLIAWMLAQITRGELSGNLLGKPRKVVVIGEEDSFDHIWVPRLKVAGADLDMVQYIVAGTDKGVFDVREDAEALRKYIKGEKVALVYIDQLLDNLGIANSWKDKDVRDALAPLRNVAHDTKVAILATMHPNKRQGTFRDMMSGTPAFNALSRSSLLVAHHPHEPGRIAVVLGKGNYASERNAFEFRIEGQEFRLPGRTIKTSRITDIRITALTREQLLEDKKSRKRDDSKASVAERALRDLLADGEERSAGAVQKQLHREHGLTAREVTAASKRLKLAKRKAGFQGEWYWSADSAETPKAHAK